MQSVSERSALVLLRSLNNTGREGIIPKAKVVRASQSKTTSLFPYKEDVVVKVGVSYV